MEQVRGVGGWLAWPLSGRVQNHCRQNGARRGRCGAPRCRARVAVHRACDAVQVRVHCGAGGAMRVREHGTRSGRAG
jgi:hypothetical protein